MRLEDNDPDQPHDVALSAVSYQRFPSPLITSRTMCRLKCSLTVLMTILGFLFLITEVEDPAIGSVLKYFWIFGHRFSGAGLNSFTSRSLFFFSICVNGAIVVGWSQSDFADSHILLT